MVVVAAVDGVRATVSKCLSPRTDADTGFAHGPAFQAHRPKIGAVANSTIELTVAAATGSGLEPITVTVWLL